MEEYYSVEGEEELVIGQAEVWQLMHGYVDSMVIKRAVELGIPDIIHRNGGPISLSQLASGIDAPRVDSAYLVRIMRYLVRRQVFNEHNQHGKIGEETLYGLTRKSRWLLTDLDTNLNPMVLLQRPSPLPSSPGGFVKEGGPWDFASQNPQLNNVYNHAMSCTAKLFMKALLPQYRDGFSESIKTLVDVGGGTGTALAEIVKVHPHINGINLDLPHVVATAPDHAGVKHVEGDMFEDIPKADAVLMQRVLHSWGDDYCVKILRNCRKAMPEKGGKLILVEIVLKDDGSGSFGDVGLIFDMLMLFYTLNGRERTEAEWKAVLEKGGFPRYKIIEIPALVSVIEAYPE
ncbi:(R,S)-reticuline 7-O-methyltransferase-like [Tripterygium wilfordii]|uniref:(R,S)-reticuline 7-O-methyltransferase-like n=1 Tax=Tripterygium wilfordii TaxID=458696 RepID=UPI0018F83986|nr:(R,S)-reticuline 7-O-methyltransferase-like [Tripterygium wilfordii]